MIPLKRRNSPVGERLRLRHRLRRRADFSICYTRGRKRHGALASLHSHCNATDDARLGITASRRVGNSVVRHRLKRQVREIFRKSKHRAVLTSLDVVVHLKPAAAKADFVTLETEIESLFESLAVKR